ncbi:fibronectin type III domain-containing protein [Nonlabens sp.]|uniref:fibronectin type III domain-containing protein n=1 Tax=Nonlabens sp. TaxID=1888209 RepID=UPI001BD0237B|nr:fibronectin type III domain-containing protein [Nonlabens sp.]
MPDGTAVGAMNYWDGTNWVSISPGANGEVLKFVNNAPAWGMVEATVPDAPTIVSAVAGNGQATITFNAPAFNGYSTITSYTATSSPNNISDSVSQSGDGTITVSGLTNGTSYTFTITATNALGTSVVSNVSQAVIPDTVPDAPTIVSAVAGNGQATITFNAPAFNGSSTITSYTATSSPDNISDSVSQSGDGTITVSGLTNGTSYTFTITATNAFGTSVVSNVSQAVIPGNIYDNLATTAFGIDYGNKSKIGQQFLATGGGQLVQVEVNLFRTNSQSGTFTVELWSNIANSTHPLAKLATLNSSDWSNMPLNSITPYSITSFTQNYTLIAGTYYWLVVSQPANGPAAKRWAINGSGLGQTAEYNNNNSTWTNLGSSQNFGARIKIN